MGGVSVGSQNGCSGGGGKFGMEQSNHLGVDLAETVSEPSCLGTPPSLELLPDSGTPAIWLKWFLAHSPQLGTAELVA